MKSMAANVPSVPVFGIVPAAGSGRRMGRAKQVLPYGGSTLVGSVARTLLSAGLDAVVVVTRSELATRLGLPADGRLSVAINDDPFSEMIDSVRIGLSALFADSETPGGSEPATTGPTDRAADRAGILVVPGDMPALAVATCRLCAETFRRAPTRIIVAADGGRRGHPIVFPAALRPVVRRLEGGLNTLLDMHRDRLCLVETGDPAVLEDVDTWEQYQSRLPASSDDASPPDHPR